MSPARTTPSSSTFNILINNSTIKLIKLTFLGGWIVGYKLINE